jgi:hypothetical protein
MDGALAHNLEVIGQERCLFERTAQLEEALEDDSEVPSAGPKTCVALSRYPKVATSTWASTRIQRCEMVGHFPNFWLDGETSAHVGWVKAGCRASWRIRRGLCTSACNVEK